MREAVAWAWAGGRAGGECVGAGVHAGLARNAAVRLQLPLGLPPPPPPYTHSPHCALSLTRRGRQASETPSHAAAVSSGSGWLDALVCSVMDSSVSRSGSAATTCGCSAAGRGGAGRGCHGKQAAPR